MILMGIALGCIAVLGVALLYMIEVALTYRDMYRRADAIGREAAELLRKQEETK